MTILLARLAAATLCALVVSGCGASAEKQAVNRYFRQVSALQREMLLPLSRINQAYRDFSLRPRSTARELPALTNAELTLRELRTRLVALDSPRSATRVRRLLVHLLDVEVTTAHELRSTAAYLPASQRALAPLTRANRVFRSTFARAKGANAQAAVLEAYAVDIAQARASLARVDPPALLQPSHDAELATLTHVRGVSIRLAAALRAHDRATVDRLVPQFRAAASSAGDRRQAAAIRHYDARVSEITRTTAAIESERLRLEKRIG